MTKRASLPLIFGLLACLALGACAGEEEAFSYTQLSPVPPPDVPYEPAPRAENPMAEIWRPGHWSYTGTEFFWVPGVMLPRPSITAVWAPDRWDQRAYGWAFVPGYWQ
jgi:hypothetical protein